MKLFVQTYGCQMNEADSVEMARHFKERGFAVVPSAEEADIVLLNTCTVRQHAENRALSFIGRMEPWRSKNSERVLIVAGCASERLKGTLRARFPFVDLVVGAKSIGSFPEVIDKYFRNRTYYNWFEESENAFGAGKLRTAGAPMVLGTEGESTFVTIMRGCNYSCSYCIVPAVRGREIYREPAALLKEVETGVRAGASKIMLLGQTVNSYQYETMDFAGLLLAVSSVPGVREIKFMSPHPHYMNSALIENMADIPQIPKEIHLPVQSGSDKILKSMKRNYTRTKFSKTIRDLKDAMPDIRISTDFIVGFPGETEEDFQSTLSLAEECGFAAAYCFKYSARPGTAAAAQMKDDVPRKTKEARLDALLKFFKSREKDLS